MFDPELGWEPALFEVDVAMYQPKDWGNVQLYADWEKVNKGGTNYYNVLRVHK